MEVFDVELLKKGVDGNGGICRVEPTIQDVRAVCLVLQIRLSKTGIESFGSISERKIKSKALKLAFVKTTNHMPYIKSIRSANFALFQKPISCVDIKNPYKNSWVGPDEGLWPD